MERMGFAGPSVFVSIDDLLFKSNVVFLNRFISGFPE
jgi:hypothetical protein